MTELELIRIADAAYPDGGEHAILRYWDERVNPGPNYTYTLPELHECEQISPGDTLAQFICYELIETFNPDAPDIQQLDDALNAIYRAYAELGSVYVALVGRRERLIIAEKPGSKKQ